MATTFQGALFMFAAVTGLYAPAVQAQDIGLPGGATSLREVHGDWVVSCAITGEGAEARKLCTMSQEQQEGNSGRRVIAMELQPSQDFPRATLVLPFGLDLVSGAQLQIDDGTPGQALPFRTCLPAGCIVSADIDAEMLAALRSGAALKVHTKADGGRQTVFSISLKGFGGAFDRTSALAE